MASVRLPFVDWMKCVGMFLIVLGHVAEFPGNVVTAPIYPKQLGVTFFLFVSGYTLARERRPALRVVVGRLFEILFVGLVCAVSISLIRLALGLGPNPSNYLPLALGVNVVFNNFPANPTTWYIGTYIHIVLLWALVWRHVRVDLRLFALVLVAEIVIRAGLWWLAGSYVSYMLFTNWLTVFLLGMLAGQRSESLARWRPSPAWMLLPALAIAWLLVGQWLIAFDLTNVFRLPVEGPMWWRLTLMSTSVSLLYLGMTWLAFRAATYLPSVGIVRFLAANTLVIFVVHMPLFWALRPSLAHLPAPWRGITMLLICFVGVAVVGEIFGRLVHLAALREAVLRRFEPTAGTAPAAAASSAMP